MAQPLRAVLIDLDGTLMDTVPDLAAATNLMRADFGLAALPTERVAAFVGKGADVLVHRALTDRLDGNVDAEQFARGRAAFYRHYHETNGRATVIFDGVEDALELMASRGIRLACVTNKPREFTVPLLQRVQVANYFDAVVAGDDVQHKKPHPDLLLAACEKLQVDPGAARMIGDSENDALAAQAAGMRVILVTTGYNEGGSVTELADAPGCDAIVDSLLDAAALLVEAMQKDSH